VAGLVLGFAVPSTSFRENREPPPGPDATLEQYVHYDCEHADTGRLTCGRREIAVGS
jgi:hypothetical protein